MAILLNGTYFPNIGIDLITVLRDVEAIEAYPSGIGAPSELLARLPAGAEKCGLLAVCTR